MNRLTAQPPIRIGLERVVDVASIRWRSARNPRPERTIHLHCSNGESTQLSSLRKGFEIGELNILRVHSDTTNGSTDGTTSTKSMPVQEVYSMPIRWPPLNIPDEWSETGRPSDRDNGYRNS
jgi:hypothetical protein